MVFQRATRINQPNPRDFWHTQHISLHFDLMYKTHISVRSIVHLSFITSQETYRVELLPG